MSCGNGSRVRIRSCSDGFVGELGCIGNTEGVEECNINVRRLLAMTNVEDFLNYKINPLLSLSFPNLGFYKTVARKLTFYVIVS